MTTPLPPKSVEAKPYKGPESYQVEDAELFFGRDREADQLIAKILSAKLTLLHAQSGAGKTSLLNARVIPGLEERGWGALRILPQNDPIVSTRVTVLRYVLPPPLAEAQAIERALAAFGLSAAQTTLVDLLAAYDDLKPRDQRRRALIEPLPSAEDVPALVAGADLTPVFCRLLRSTLEPHHYVQHLDIIRRESLAQTGAPAATPRLNGQSCLSEFLELLNDPAYGAAYANLLRVLDVPVNDLTAFFEQLFAVYGQGRTRLSLVLIFDQFEELFTRFIDPGLNASQAAADLPDWRMRGELFGQLEKLYSYGALQPDAKPTESGALQPEGAGLPLRLVISMREEFIAQLGPLRRFVWNLDSHAYHLQLLDKKQAEAAIKKPADEFGYAYSEKCYESLLSALTKEERFIEPAHLQLVCEKLWNVRGRALAQAAGTTGLHTLPEIEFAVFDQLGQARGILKSFFNDFINSSELDAGERLETLEMLEPLVTASGTRNIVEYNRLVRVPFRQEGRRRRLLNHLINRTIVRTERRLGGYFVEITHEFLIGPILEALREVLNRDVKHTQFRLALNTLERIYQGSRMGDAFTLLPPRDFLTLHQRCAEWELNAWSAEQLFRSALNLTDFREVPDYPALLKRWAEQLECLTPPPTTVTDQPTFVIDPGELMSLYELRAVDDNREHSRLTVDECEAVFRSALHWATAQERKLVDYWTRRFHHDADENSGDH